MPKQDPIHIRDELVLVAHPDGPYILLRREGEHGTARFCLNEVRYLAGALCSMAAEMAGMITGDDNVGEVDGGIGTMVAWRPGYRLVPQPETWAQVG